ncbi:uncharacterized protein LOC5578497 isoform X2 [Aedes aegypti]|nr:uncharacterized protein LOC5578497 isoform X2 [Aedes aegypti]XP_021704303.1 uncharacterized protein LOC5578497 isoform X2 [Aedes aegypti]
MFDQYIYKRNESNLDVSLSVPHYNGQHGQHYNMNDHTSNLDDSFFESSSSSSSPARSFFDSSDGSSCSRSISPFGDESPFKADEFFRSSTPESSSESMDVNDDDFFETSSEKALFSEHSSEESDNEEHKDSGFVSVSSRISMPIDAGNTLSMHDVSIESNLPPDEDVDYWSELMTCNRVRHLYSDNKLSLNAEVKDCNEKKLHKSENKSRQYVDLKNSLKQNNRIGILECEEILDHEKPTKGELEHRNEIQDSKLVHSKIPETSKRMENEKSITLTKSSPTNELQIVLENEEQLTNDCLQKCSEASECSGTLTQNSFRSVENTDPITTTKLDCSNAGTYEIQEICATTENTQKQSLPSELNFGAWLPSQSDSLTPQDRSRPTLNVESQETICRFPSAKKNSIIPQLEMGAFCSFDDIPVRQKEIMSTIGAIFQRLSQSELEGSKLVLLVKTRATWDMCAMENDILTRQSTPEESMKTINYHHKHSKPRFVLIVFLLSEIFRMLASGSSCTKRELYYRDPQITINQRCVDECLRDVCFLLKSDLWELNVFCSSKGLIAGPVKFQSKLEETIDCFNSFGTQIPTDVNGLLSIELDADLVLIVEKDTVFRRLLDDGILTRLSKKIIVVTSKGYPDVATRLLLKKIRDEHRIPMYALVDADPFGIEIYCVYKFGSLALSHQSSHLAVPSIQWLGLRPSHTVLLDLKLLPLTPRDESRIRELLRRPYIGQPGCELERELKMLQENNGKAEIESLADISVDYLISEYLPNQLRLVKTQK